MGIERVEAASGSGGAFFGVDTVVASGGDAQIPYCKLMSATDASTELIGGTAANGLQVDVTRVSGSVAVTNAGLTELAAAINGNVLDINIAAQAGALNVAQSGTWNIGTVTVVSAVTAITNALPAGTNAIGKLAANSGVDIGDIDVTSILPGVAATNLGKAEDAAHASGDVGVMALSVRQDAAAALAGTDADYQPLITDASGRLHVNVGNTINVASHAVTNAGTFAVQIAAGAAAVGKAEDVASADADVGVPAMAVRKATPANTSGTDGDYEMLQMSAGRLWVSAILSGLSTTRSYKTASGTLTADTDIVAAVTSKRIKVYALSVTTVGTSANAAIWKSNGTSGTELWRTLLQGAAATPMGERLAVSPGVDGAFIFATVAGEKLTLDVGNGDALHYSIAYWDDDAT